MNDIDKFIDRMIVWREAYRFSPIYSRDLTEDQRSQLEVLFQRGFFEDDAPGSDNGLFHLTDSGRAAWESLSQSLNLVFKLVDK